MSPKQVDRAAKRGAVLEAAIQLFARQGYAATRVDDVAREAGVAKGTVYLYFGSREELLVAAFDTFSKRSAAIVEEARQPGCAIDRLHTLVRSVLSMIADEPTLSRVLLDLWSARRDTTPLIDMAATYRDYRTAIAALLRDGIAQGVVRPDATEHHATVVVAAIEGCVVQWLADPSLPLGALAEPVIGVLIDGLGQRADANHGAAT
jgi:AcrR family transcriptional regulator